MIISHKISVDKVKSSNFRVFARDETGPITKTNTGGYGGNNGNPISAILKYIFVLKDHVSGETYPRVFGPASNEVNNPPVERIGYREDVEIYPTSKGTLKDSIYTLQGITVMEYEFLGSGIKDQDFIINIQGFSLIKNYNTIITDKGVVYKIQSLGTDNNPLIFLDRPIVDPFENFYVGFSSTTEPFMLNQDLQDCLSKKIAEIVCNSNCNEGNFKSLNELRMLYWGLERSMEIGDYLQAADYMKKCKDICSVLKCNC